MHINYLDYVLSKSLHNIHIFVSDDVSSKLLNTDITKAKAMATPIKEEEDPSKQKTEEIVTSKEDKIKNVFGKYIL